jgi:hypothetical protein
VYLLPHVSRERFKVGWSRYPLQRAQQLPEYLSQQIDLDGAQVAWFAQAQRAHQVERALHRGLAPYKADAGHWGVGRTEWFGIQGLVLACRMLHLLPAGEGVQSRIRLLPLRDAPDAPNEFEALPLERTALDAWYRTEDVWLRLGTLLPLTLDVAQEWRQLTWVGLRRLDSPGLTLLRSQAVNLDTYEWREGGRRCSLVSLLDWAGDDLLLDLTSSRQLKRWPEGDAVDGYLRAFLARHARIHGREPTAAR